MHWYKLIVQNIQQEIAHLRQLLLGSSELSTYLTTCECKFEHTRKLFGKLVIKKEAWKDITIYKAKALQT